MKRSWNHSSMRMLAWGSIVWLVAGAAFWVAGCGLFKRTTDAEPVLDMVRVEGGTFRMGDFFEGRSEDALPVHTVHVETFYLARHEVTYEQYDTFARATGRPLPPDDGYGRGSRAVVHVTWDDAVAFCAYHGYRLPTEAEWEYAARSGGKNHVYAGTSEMDELARYAFYAANSPGFSSPVGLKQPNELGLHDMSGNVSEWIGAFYETYPTPGEKPVYKDLDRPGIRILRGGNFLPSADNPRPSETTRTYWRTATLNDLSSSSIGFRCAK